MPFFWFKPGEMDLGGDGGRLYFYDPINQIIHLALTYVAPSGTGSVEASFYYLPFFTMLAVLKSIFNSSYFLISLNNALKLVVGFLSVYAIVKELIGKRSHVHVSEISAILAGIFYLFSPAMVENYVKALPSHNQVFLNPLMFYLFLRFFLTNRMKYLWWGIMLSVLFAPSFSYTAAPPIFAFYPLAIVFITLYSVGIRGVVPSVKKLLVAFVLFLGLQAFHLIPEALDLFTTGANTNLRVFDAVSIKEQIGYFYGVLGIPKISFYILALSATNSLPWASMAVPFITLLGLYFNQEKKKTILMAAIFFLVTFFFVTGKVTMSGIKLYEWFFYIPGFTMFRNFYGQWQFVFYFYYALLFGLSIASILHSVKMKFFPYILFLMFAGYFAISSWSFINGAIVNPYREEANGIKGAIIMDPKYEEALSYIRSLPEDGKILVLPFTDSYVQVIHGLNTDGAYVGHSSIGQLTGIKDFAGYQDMIPFSDSFWQRSKAKDYEAVKKMLGILNVRYIFYNSDVRIYDETFPGRPYSQNYVRKYLPSNQADYKEFISNISGEKVFETGYYSIYKTEEKSYLPHIYTPDQVHVYQDDPALSIYGKALAFLERNTEKVPLYIEYLTCSPLFSEAICSQKIIPAFSMGPKIQYVKINPTKYKVKIFGASHDFILNFSDSYNRNWKIYISNQQTQEIGATNSYFDGKIQEGRHGNSFFENRIFETMQMKSLSERSHFLSNGYANAWLIRPSDVDGRSNYDLIIEMTGQRAFYISLGISTAIFIGCLLWGLRLFILQLRNRWIF